MSNNSSLPKDNTGRCTHLRSKSIYMDLSFHPSGMESEGTPCWCFKTQQVFGPDGDTTGYSMCASGRTCYESDGFDQA